MHALGFATTPNELPLLRHRDRANKRRPMPATRDDIALLNGVLYMLKSPRVNAGDHVFRRQVIDALERAIAVVTEPEHNSPTWWVLGAIKGATRKVRPGQYAVEDTDLFTWAMDQLYEMYGEHDD